MFGILDQQIVPTSSKGDAHNMVFKLREIYSIQKSPFVAQMFMCAKIIYLQISHLECGKHLNSQVKKEQA